MPSNVPLRLVEHRERKLDESRIELLEEDRALVQPSPREEGQVPRRTTRREGEQVYHLSGDPPVGLRYKMLLDVVLGGRVPSGYKPSASGR